MKVNIWSDVRCPFCYIGKHKFEQALEQFDHKDKIEVEWHSFELDPGLKTMPEKNSLDHLAETKGMSRTQVEQMTTHAAKMGKEAGLSFDFDRSVIANSFNAHRLIQMAKANGLDSEAEEVLFKAHFTNGENIDDNKVLIDLGTEIGLNPREVEEMLNSDSYTKEVRADQNRAQMLGVRGVPFFVFNDKYGVSGAQAPEVFLQALDKSYEEYAKEHQPFIINDAFDTDGAACTVDGICD